MSVNTQVSGNKQLNIQPSKNQGTVVNTQVSGNYREGVHEYKKITDVQPTQVSGERHNTNYMGINDEGMDIRAAKKITGNELNVETFNTAQIAKATFINEANEEIARQEADKKRKNLPDIVSLVSIEITQAPTKVAYEAGEYFDPTGIEVTATYSDDSTADVTANVTYTPTVETALTVEDNSVTVAYEGKTDTVTITVTAPEIEEETPGAE